LQPFFNFVAPPQKSGRGRAEARPYKGKSERESATPEKEKGELCEPQLARRYDNRLKTVCK